MSKFLQREEVFDRIRKILEPAKGNGQRRLRTGGPGFLKNFLRGTKQAGVPTNTGEGK